jgi:hypothetical protein
MDTAAPTQVATAVLEDEQLLLVFIYRDVSASRPVCFVIAVSGPLGEYCCRDLPYPRAHQEGCFAVQTGSACPHTDCFDGAKEGRSTEESAERER